MALRTNPIDSDRRLAQNLLRLVYEDSAGLRGESAALAACRALERVERLSGGLPPDDVPLQAA